MANSVSELREEIKLLTNDRVDIMLDDQTFKSTYQIFKELSEVWGDLSDITQANILEQLGGKRNANAVQAIIQSFDLAEQALIESQNAAGSALAENEKYLDSINGKLDQLKASWEQLSVSVLNSEVVKGLIDLLRSIIELFNRMDEATNGVSSGLLALLTVFGLGKTVFSAFKFQAKDTTTLLGSLMGVLFGAQGVDSKASSSALGRGLAALKKNLSGLSHSIAANKKEASSWGAALGANIKLLAPYAAGLAAIAWALYGAYKAQEKYNPSLSELRENTEDLQSEVNELNSSLETNKKRIEELQSLADNGTISFVEQDELDRLNSENELLETQLRLKQSLLEIAEGKEADKARSDAEAFFSGSPVTLEGEDGSSILTSLAGFETQKERIKAIDAEIADLTQQAASATGNNADKILQQIQKLQQERQSALGAMSNIADPLVTMMDSLDPVKDSALIDQIQTLVYQVQYLSEDATALSQIWDDIWGDESRFPGITDFKKQIVAAAAAQKEFNDELAQYGGNVDMTARPNVTVTRDMVEGGLWNFDDEYSTVHSVTYTSDDFKDFDVQGTSAIVVTPIMPDGNTFDSEEDLYNYLASLIQDGEFHFENDTEGIIMGVVDEGSVEKSLEKAAEIEQKAHEINAWYYDLLRSDQFKEISDAFAEIGIDLSQYPAGDLAEMFERLGVSAEAAETSISGLADALDSLTEKMDLLKSAQEEYNTYGALSASTLSDIAEKFPELEESIGLYIAGMKSGKELLEDLSGAYQDDVSEYKDSMVQKLAASNAFYNSLSEKQKQYIKDLASSYDVDLGNFKTIEAAKLNFQAQIIQKLAQNYSKYTGQTLAQLKAYRDSLDNSAWKENNPEYQALTEAIKAAEAFNSNMDDIISGKLETWNPSTFKDHSSSSSSSTDTYKKSVEEKIDALKHQLAIEKITAEQYYNGLEAIENQYYKDSTAHLQKYADEIRSIDEELFEGRRELNEDWLNDQQDFAERAGAGGDYAAQQDYYNGMFSKLQEMIKAAKDYGLDETSDYVQELYDKVDQLQSDILASVKESFEDFESYMDDFDLWKGSDFSKLDWLKHELNEIIALYDKGQLGWAQYTEARNEIAKKMYDTQRDSLEEILELTMDMIKAEAEDQVEAIDDQLDLYQRLIDKKKELLQDTKDEADHEEEVAEKVKEIAELQSKIAQLSLDDSREATAKKSELETQLAEKQKELADLQKDYALDQALDALDKTQEAFEEEKETEKDAVEESVDSWQKLYEKAIARIEGDWDGLYSDLLTYSKEHRDSIDGPDSLVTAWKNATSAMQEYNNSFEDAYNNIGDISINPNANQSSKAQAILQKMQANSALANTLGKSVTPDGRNLHEENVALAQQYYELTGQKLVYDNGWRLDNASGQLAYDHSSSTTKTNSTTQTTTSNKNTSSTGAAYEATKAALGRDMPTGTLQEGSHGNDVLWLQTYLQKTGDLPTSVTPDGYFYSRTKQALQSFQSKHELNPDGIYGEKTRKKIPLYHTGGIVGDAGSINDTEVLALLKKGEWVLDDTRKQNLKAMFATLKDMTGSMMSSSLLNRMQVMKPAVASSGGDTFAPQISVSIQHNGSMTDKDAKKYGDMVANTALDQLKSAFAKRGKR